MEFSRDNQPSFLLSALALVACGDKDIDENTDTGIAEDTAAIEETGTVEETDTEETDTEETDTEELTLKKQTHKIQEQRQIRWMWMMTVTDLLRMKVTVTM